MSGLLSLLSFYGGLQIDHLLVNAPVTSMSLFFFTVDDYGDKNISYLENHPDKHLQGNQADRNLMKVWKESAKRRTSNMPNVQWLQL